jgi:tetratricopeptide (TPR) repeat protein
MEFTNAVAELRMRWRAAEPVKRLPYRKFLPLLKTAVAAEPDRIDLKLQFATALFYSHRMQEIVEWLTPFAGAPETHPQLLYYLGRAALSTKDYQLALQCLEPAAAKGSVHSFGYLAETLRYLRRRDQALDAALQGLDHLPSDYKALGIAVQILIERGDTERLWRLCMNLRDRGAWGSYVPSAMAHSASTPEQFNEVDALVDRPRWFSANELGVPEGFNETLIAELLLQKGRLPLPSTLATLGSGNRIDQLELAGGAIVQELLGRIRAAVERYATERQCFTDHPLIAHQPACITLSSWALDVHRDGHEAWHIHPSGWISGVYYVKVPEVEASSDGHSGAIGFGPYPFGLHKEIPSWPHWHVMPKAGLLVLFPSYYAHRTWPTGVNDPRICVAFDVVPSAPLP